MRLAVLAAIFTVIGGAVAVGQPAPSALPRAFADYEQHDITPGLCRIVGPSEAQCIIPAMTAGQYLIEAAGVSTAQGPDAAQAIQIMVGTFMCGSGQNAAPWTGPRTLRLDCQVSILTDKTLTVRVIYQDAHATKDPKGPQLSIRRQAWEGVLSSKVFAPQQ